MKKACIAIAFICMVCGLSALGGCKAVQTDKNQAPVQKNGSGANTAVSSTNGDRSAGSGSGVAKNGFILPGYGKRPFAVMIDNEGLKSLPQGGLNMAQLIYEIVVEGGETRLMPVFWGVDPTMIGPVRSARHYFLDYAMENDAIYVHYGWSPMALSDIGKYHINHIDWTNASGIFRDITSDRNNWQDTYTSMDKLAKQAGILGFRTTTEKPSVFKYNNDYVPLTGGSKAYSVSIKYSETYACGFEYDPAAKLYMRFRKDKPQMERVSRKQLAAANIVIQMVRNSRIPNDKKDRQTLDNVGHGDGWFITGGSAIAIKWSKSSREEATVYTDAQGKPIVLNPGQTWVQIVPIYGKVDMK